jgi:hypothetical protein
VNIEQCNENALKNTPINGECDIYDEICKINCSKLTSYTECTTREDDCFWLLENTTISIEAVCTDKV